MSSSDKDEASTPEYDTLGQMVTDGVEFEVIERDKSGIIQQRWRHDADNNITLIQPPGKSHGLFFRSMREWRKALFDAFLPVGFPHSVSKDYLAYQTYDSLQAFFSTITSLLANRALLEGLGVGDADSSATFAMLLTILKDAMSRIATIIFAQRFGLRIEPDAKRYRFLADVFNDTAFFLELSSPYLGPWGKVVALSTGEALRALCGVAAGASKAALSVHFAKHDNLAELNAKEASQETAVGLVGLLVGTLVVNYIEDPRIVLYLMTVLVFAHLWMNYLGVRSVCMTTLNRQRATLLFSEYLTKGIIATPEEIAQKEAILFWNPVIQDIKGKPLTEIEFSKSYRQAASRPRGSSELFVFDANAFTVLIHYYANGVSPMRMLLHDNARAEDALTAWYAAVTLGNVLSERSRRKVEKATWVRPMNNGLPEELREAMADKGWQYDTHALETGAPVRVSMRPTGRKYQ